MLIKKSIIVELHLQSSAVGCVFFRADVFRILQRLHNRRNRRDIRFILYV